MSSDPGPGTGLEKEMKTIPVYDNFDRQKILGYMRVDIAKLPMKPNYHFALEGRILDATVEKDGTRVVTRFELTAVNAIPDKDFTDKV